MPATLGALALALSTGTCTSLVDATSTTPISTRCMTTTLRPIPGRGGPICPVGSTCQARQWSRASCGSLAVAIPSPAQHNAYIGQDGSKSVFNRLLHPETTNALQVYDPATNSWTSGPSLNQQRSFPAGTAVGNTAVAVGGYTGSNTTTSVEINMAGGGCASPTPTVPPRQHRLRRRAARQAGHPGHGPSPHHIRYPTCATALRRPPRTSMCSAECPMERV